MEIKETGTMTATIIRTFAAVLLCLICCCASAQTRTVTGEATFYGDDNTTPKEAKAEALKSARIAALAKEFGTTVTQTVISDESIRSGGESSFFSSLSESEVKGEWINDIGEPKYKLSYDDEGHIIVWCAVKGLAREISNSAADFAAEVLRNGADLRNKDTRFRSGDDFRLYFKAPQDGYVAVYLVGEDRMAYTLLPYSGNADGQVKVKHGREYIFFDAALGDKSHGEVDEIELRTDEPAEHNKIYVLFSPNPFVKANDSFTGENLPRALRFNDFHRWLTGLRKKDPAMGQRTFDIIINSSNQYNN